MLMSSAVQSAQDSQSAKHCALPHQEQLLYSRASRTDKVAKQESRCDGWRRAYNGLVGEGTRWVPLMAWGVAAEPPKLPQHCSPVRVSPGTPCARHRVVVTFQ